MRSRCVAVLMLLGLIGCQRESGRGTPPASAGPAPSASGAPARVVEPTALLTTQGSAYAASLFVDEKAFYLLTSSAAYRLAPGRAPERWALELGIAPVLTASHIVYWFDGAIRQVPKQGGEPALLAKVAHAPQRFAASGERFVWLSQAEDGKFSLHTLAGSQPKLVFAPEGYVAALALLDDQVFFVEQQAGGTSWRLGVVPLAGGSPRHTPTQRGRTPSMLATAGDVFYYDGPSRTVRRVSPDLKQVETVGRDIICSPIAVFERIYCAQPNALLELPRQAGRSARVLPRGRRGTITAVAASRSMLGWLVDGGDQLAVEMLPMSAIPPP